MRIRSYLCVVSEVQLQKVIVSTKQSPVSPVSSVDVVEVVVGSLVLISVVVVGLTGSGSVLIVIFSVKGPGPLALTPATRNV